MKASLRRINPIFLSLAALGLIAVVGLTLLHARQSDATLLRTRALASRLSLTEERLKNDVMATREGFGGDGDKAILRDTAQLRAQRDALASLSLPADIRPAIHGYLVAAEREQALVEAFNPLNAAVLTSRQRLLEGIARLGPLLPDTGPNRNVQHQLADVLIATVRLDLASPRPAAGDITAVSAKAFFNEAESGLPQYRDVLRSLSTDFHRIESKGPELDATTRSIIESGTRHTLVTTQNLLDRRIAHASTAKSRAIIASIGVLAALLLALMSLIVQYVWTLRNGARQTALMRSLLDSIPDLLWFKDPNGLYLACNPVFESFVGRTERQIIGKRDLDLFPKEQAEFFRAHDTAAIQAGRPTENEESLVFANDQHRALVKTTKTPVYSDDGALMGVLGISHDVTQERLDQDELRRHRDDLDLLVKNRTSELQSINARLHATQFAMDRVGIGITWADARTGKFLDVNRYHAEILEYSREEMLALTIFDIDPDYTNRRYQEILGELRKKGFLKFECRHRTKSGKIIQVERTLYYNQTPEGDRVIAFMVEISLRKDHERALIAARDAAEKSSRANRVLVHQLEAANRELSRSDQRLKSMLAISQRATNLDEHVLLIEGIDEVTRLTSSAVGYLHFVEDDQERIALKAWSCGANQPRARLAQDMETVSAAAIWGDTVLLKRPSVHNTHPCLPVALDVPAPSVRHVSVPVIDGDKVHMVLTVGDKATNYDESDINNLQLIANDLWQIVLRRRSEIDLAQAKLAAEAATHAKSVFLANMSHEIRTPLNAVTGLTQLALQTGLCEKQRDYIEGIQNASESLLGVINDILDFSKIEAGRLTLEHIDFRLEDVMGKLAMMIGKRAEEKGLELLFMPLVDMPTALVGDPLRLTQILVNLGSNAIKFTHTGEITFGIEVVALTVGAVELHFWVRDTGIGISPEHQSRLFESFSQADDSITRQYGGTGLGLAISKTLVEMMGGRIWLESAVGRGATFHFHARFEQQHETHPRYALEAEVLSGSRVLVVDDNAASRAILVDMIQRFGLRVDVADGCAAAVARVDEASVAGQPYDLVLMDWKMPEVDGIACLDTLRSRIGAAPAAVMVTAFGREQAMTAARARGIAVDSVLTKPVTPSTLVEAVARALGKTIRTQTRVREIASDQAQAVEKLRGARVLVVDDSEMNQLIVVELLSKVGIDVVVAGNGREAIDRLAQADDVDGVLMDCQMPVMDGYTATRTLRRRPAFADLPILALTANAMTEDRARVLEAGMNDHIAKPINLQHMLVTMAKWIQPHRRRRETASQAPPLGPAAISANLPELPGIDVATGRDRCGGDLELYRRLLRQFSAGQLHFVEIFSAQIRNDDHTGARRAAHTLKGNAGTIGAAQLQAVADDLERACLRGFDASELRLRLEAVSRELEIVLAGVHQLAIDPAVNDASAMPVLDHMALNHAAVRLRTLLVDGDAQAVEAAETLAAMLGGSDLAMSFRAVADAVGRYAFGEALVKLDDFIGSGSAGVT